MMSRQYNETSTKKPKSVRKEEKKEKCEEVIPIPHRPLKDETDNSKTFCDFSFKEQLGEGTFGYVRMAVNNQTGEKVEIKILEKKKLLEYEDIIRIQREIKILKKVRHPNIIHLYSVLQTEENIFIITEYAEGIELFDYIAIKRKIDERTACHIYQQIISGLEYLHKNNVVHRDIKPENLIINRKNKELKIVDFGLSNIFDNDKKKLLSSSCGSPSYAAPEMLNGKKYRPNPVDIWSSGIVLFAMICGFLPFEDENNDALYRKICIGKFTIPDHVSSDCRDLLKRILVTDPNRRITIKQIKNHPWFKLYTVNGEVILYEGLFIDKYIIPIDEEIVENMSIQMNIRPDSIKLCILNNNHSDITTLYYLYLLKKIKMNKKTVADLKSDLFKEYIKNKNNLIINNLNKNTLNQSNLEITKHIFSRANNLMGNNRGEGNINNNKKRPVSYREFDYANNLNTSIIKGRKGNELNNSKNDYQNHNHQITDKGNYLNSSYLKKRPVSYGDFDNNLNTSNIKGRKGNELNNSKNKYQNQNHLITEKGNNFRQTSKQRDSVVEKKNQFDEEEDYRQKSEKRRETNTNKENKKKAKINNRDNNEKLEQILLSLKKEMKNKYLGKSDIKEDNQKEKIKTNNYETAIIKKKKKHNYFNHLLSNKKKIFNTIEWDGYYQELEDKNNISKLNKNGNSSTKYGNNLTYLKNIKEKLNENNNRNNLSFKLKKLVNDNVNTDYLLINNTIYLSNEKKKKKSKNNISIIKSRKDIFPNSVIKTKYKHKKSVNQYNNKNLNISSSKSPYKLNKSSLNIISSEYDQILAQNMNQTYNHNDTKTPNYKNCYVSSFQIKDNKFINGNNRKKVALNIHKLVPNIRRDNPKITSNFNNYKNKVISKNSKEKYNLNFHSSFNEIDQSQSLSNNHTFINKNKLDYSMDERKTITTNDNYNLKDYNILEPFPLSNIFITDKHTLKNQIDDILEELKIKCKKSGFSYIINNDGLLIISIKSYYNPSINIIQYCGKNSSIMNKIHSKIKNHNY